MQHLNSIGGGDSYGIHNLGKQRSDEFNRLKEETIEKFISADIHLRDAFSSSIIYTKVGILILLILRRAPFGHE
jgi:hypothetical protein